MGPAAAGTVMVPEQEAAHKATGVHMGTGVRMVTGARIGLHRSVGNPLGGELQRGGIVVGGGDSGDSGDSGGVAVVLDEHPARQLRGRNTWPFLP